MASSKLFVPRSEAHKVFVTSKSTTHFRHLLPVARQRRNLPPNPLERAPDPVPPKDRIKWWNVVPGDRVRVMAEKNVKVREVKGINKFANRVYIEGDKKRDDMANNDVRSIYQIANPFKNVHYSGLQLYLGNYDFPPAPGSSEVRNLPVFAVRIGTSEPKWVNGRWVWQRFATATSPRLPTWRPSSQERVPIPWPEPEKPIVRKPTKYDTPADVVSQVTYSPSKLPRRYSNAIPSLASEKADDYVRMLRQEFPYSQNFPMELFAARELANPHSRGLKRQRYLALKARQQTLLEEYIDTELKKTVEGRNRREAIAEATFKWRQRLRLDRKVELKKRWVARGLQARLERRRKRAQKKSDIEKKKLRELILKASPNQVMPKV